MTSLAARAREDRGRLRMTGNPCFIDRRVPRVAEFASTLSSIHCFSYAQTLVGFARASI
jgi:hypothetical protein